VWYAQFNPVIGHEQGGRRPALIISHDVVNLGPGGRVIAVPFTTTDRGNPWHVEVDPSEGGLSRKSFARCEDVRSLSQLRLDREMGAVSDATMTKVEDVLRDLMDL
jgi:mRNA interferase MazF